MPFCMAAIHFNGICDITMKTMKQLKCVSFDASFPPNKRLCSCIFWLIENQWICVTCCDETNSVRFTLRYGNIYEYKSHHIHAPNSFHRTEPNENWLIGVQWKECVWNAQPTKLFDCFHFNHLIMTDSYAYIIQCQKKWIVGHIMRFAFNSIFSARTMRIFFNYKPIMKKKRQLK